MHTKKFYVVFTNGFNPVLGSIPRLPHTTLSCLKKITLYNCLFNVFKKINCLLKHLHCILNITFFEMNYVCIYCIMYIYENMILLCWVLFLGPNMINSFWGFTILQRDQIVKIHSDYFIKFWLKNKRFSVLSRSFGTFYS